MAEAHDPTQPLLVPRRPFAHLLSVSPSLVSKWAREGRLRRHLFGRAVRFSVADAQAIADGGLPDAGTYDADGAYLGQAIGE